MLNQLADCLAVRASYDETARLWATAHVVWAVQGPGEREEEGEGEEEEEGGRGVILMTVANKWVSTRGR